jgi:hypothetical protein
VDLDEVADELYAVPPEEFIALRTVRQDDAKLAGDRALAKQIGTLPKPSSAAWACNLLVREHREEIEGLVELGDLMREAQENLAGDELRALNQQRGRLLTALTRQASALAREAGHPVSTTVAGQIEETLRAGMSDPEAGQALLTGRLTSAMSYSGMGTTIARPDLRLVRSPEPAAPAKPAAPERKPAKPDAEERRRAREEEARRAAEEKRRRELDEARHAAEEAAAAAEEARAALDEERATAAELDARRTELQARVTELADALARAEEEADAVTAEFKRAERRRRTAERQAADAETAHEHAVARVEQLSGGHGD